MKFIYTILAALVCTQMVVAQNIGIGTATPHASAMLDVTSTNKGLLVPRVTQANRPASPATGLLIYQTNNTPGFYYYNGSAWQMLGGGSGFSLPYTGSTAGNALNITSTDGIGITGASSAATGNWYGGQFTSTSTAGSGIYGAATAATGTTYGGQFATLSTSGRGVYGGATAATGTTYGGFFESASVSGIGVFGKTTSATGLTVGVIGESNSNGGMGVVGYSLDETDGGQGVGVYGETVSEEGIGVLGFASLGSGANIGVYGNSTSLAGVGGRFRNNNSNNGLALQTTQGQVEFSSLAGAGTRMVVANATGRLSTQAIAGGQWVNNGNNIYNSNSGNVGIGTNTPSEKLHVVSENGSGVVGITYSNSDISYGGVWGRALATSGRGCGVEGISFSIEGRGVVGLAEATTGFTEGVYGQSRSINGTGVGGHATSSSGINLGVYGTTHSTDGKGVKGLAYAVSGIAIGIEGVSNSPAGFGGYFFNTNAAGVALKTTTGNVEFDALAGIGTRMVVANNAGRLSTQPIGVPISTAFQVVTSAANTAFNTTRLSYPNPSINDMVTVTPVWTGTYLKSPIGVFFTEGEWRVFRQDEVEMPLGVKFNVIVIKQ